MTKSYRLKRGGLSLLALLCLCALGLGGPAPVKIVLVWDNPAQPFTNFAWRAYSSTNAALPMSQWTAVLVTNIAVINGGAQLAYTNSYIPAQIYFTMTCSNVWGESPFSNVAATPPPPPLLNNLGVIAGQ